MPDTVAAKLADFFSQYQLRSYTKNQVLIHSGEKPWVVYYVVSGRVKVYDITYRGDEITVNVFKPATFFPMSVAIGHGSNPYTYEAESAVQVRVAPSEKVAAFLRANPEVTFDLLSRVFRGLDGILSRIVMQISGTARSRLLLELVTEVKRFGEHQSDDRYYIALNEKELGARAGLSRETVSREICKLKADNLIATENKCIVIKNLQSLEAELYPALR